MSPLLAAPLTLMYNCIWFALCRQFYHLWARLCGAKNHLSFCSLLSENWLLCYRSTYERENKFLSVPARKSCGSSTLRKGQENTSPVLSVILIHSIHHPGTSGFKSNYIMKDFMNDFKQVVLKAIRLNDFTIVSIWVACWQFDFGRLTNQGPLVKKDSKHFWKGWLIWKN